MTASTTAECIGDDSTAVSSVMGINTLINSNDILSACQLHAPKWAQVCQSGTGKKNRHRGITTSPKWGHDPAERIKTKFGMRGCVTNVISVSNFIDIG